MKLITPNWSTPSSIRAFATTRVGGLSQAPYNSLNLGDHVGDNPQLVIANRSLVRTQLPSEPIWLNQIHGTTVSTPNSRKLTAKKNIAHQADASVTNVPNEVLVVMTADCLPVLFSTKKGSVIGVAHAGWRGLHAGILENTVTEMLSLDADLNPKDLLAWMGPAIGPDSFEVGQDVFDAFQNPDGPSNLNVFRPINNRPGKYLADIYGLARARLNALGIDAISGGDRCTVKEGEEFFSYRRDGKTGRFASFIWIAK